MGGASQRPRQGLSGACNTQCLGFSEFRLLGGCKITLLHGEPVFNWAERLFGSHAGLSFNAFTDRFGAMAVVLTVVGRCVSLWFVYLLL